MPCAPPVITAVLPASFIARLSKSKDAC
jgi:hypothetical protein